MLHLCSRFSVNVFTLPINCCICSYLPVECPRMPKVAHTTIFDYKSRITDLECEVSTLKRRLDELRRAKHQVYCKQQAAAAAAARRCSSTDPDLQLEPPPPDPLAQQVTRLQNLLELSEMKYTRDTGKLSATIKQLKGEMDRLKEAHCAEKIEIENKHFTALELLKRSHTEELALVRSAHSFAKLLSHHLIVNRSIFLVF